MVVTLSPELEEMVRKMIASGDYQSEDEVIAYALSRLALDVAVDQGEAREDGFTAPNNQEELAGFPADL